ncbi:MAG: type II toxin-antitoxin system prevent-host-death family antitoxin [Magnetococcales bacterium]|nr:type II toxin-antitoxin system prevent-host-death family antitoxin [Magnetococcales bacterium]
MMQIDTAEFQAHLPDYLRRVEEGEVIRLTSRGQVFARLAPEPNETDAARKRLAMLRGSVIVGDILAPLDEEHEWTGDEDHL